MLDALRQRATGWIAQIFIVLLVLSFAVWGIPDIFTGFRADTVATVGKTEISTTDFARQYDQALQGMSRQIGRPVTSEQAQMFGLPAQVLGRLVTQATLDDVSRQFGLGISNQALAKKIAEDPAFRSPAGTFDRMQFTQLLRNAGMSEDAFVLDQHKAMLRYQISDALVGGAVSPEPYLRALHEYRSEARDIRYIVLTAAVAGQIPEPTDADLAAYFETNKSKWRAPEYRALSYFKILPADIAKPGDITDEQARANYDTNIKDYSTLERRRVSQIHFDKREEADADSAAITGGKTFDEIAAERKLTPADTALGLVTRDEIVDPKIADAAFALAANSTSNVIDSDFGFIIARVEEIQAGSVRPFDEVKEELKKKMALDQAAREIVQTYDEVEDLRAGGATLQEITAKIGVPYLNVAAVDRSGNNADGTKIADLPGGAPLLTAAFESDVGIENDAVRIEGNGYVWFEVTAVTPEHDRQLGDVRDKVVADWKQAETNKRVVEKAEELRGRIASGTPIDAAATELTLEVKTATKLTRASQPPADLAAAAVNAAFSGPTGHVAVADGAAAGNKAIVVVTNAVVPAFDPAAAEIPQIRQQVSEQIANDYLQQFLVEMQSQLGLSVNDAAVQAVVGQQLRPGV